MPTGPSAGSSPTTSEPPKPEAVAYSYEKNKTVDDVVAETDAMFAKYKKEMLAFRRRERLPLRFTDRLTLVQQKTLDDERDRQYEVYQARHPELTTSYPLVVRLMIQAGEYHSGVFRRFLKHIEQHPWRNEPEYFDRFAMYMQMLHKQSHPQASPAELSYTRERARRMLTEEKDRFKALAEQSDKVVKGRTAKAEVLKRELLLQRLLDLRRIEAEAELQLVRTMAAGSTATAAAAPAPSLAPAFLADDADVVIEDDFVLTD